MGKQIHPHEDGHLRAIDLTNGCRVTPAHLLGNLATFARPAALAVVTIQAVFCILAAATHLMLHGDGAYFVFGLAIGDAWNLKWSGLLTRIAIYLSTVFPTQIVANILHLTGDQIAFVNGFVFYCMPAFQFAVIILLAWKRFPQFLIFPVAQYVFSTALAFGFPSEIHLAPGFFWICLFALLHRPTRLWIFAISFTGLAFTHEAAIPSAILVSVFAYLQTRSIGVKPSAERIGLLLLIALILSTWLLVRLSGEMNGDSGFIYFFDPRKVLHNPTLWLLVGLCSAIASGIWMLRPKPDPTVFFCAAGVCLALPLLLHPWLNFAQGRYEARTFIALGLLIFGAIFVVAVREYNRPLGDLDQWRLATVTPLLIIAALALNVGASLAFLWDWTQAVAGFQRIVGRATESDASAVFVSYAEAQQQLTAGEAKANDRVAYSWTWPFRSVDLAPDYRPKRIIFDPDATDFACSREKVILTANRSSVPPEIRRDLVTFACAHPAPARSTLSGRLIERVRELLQRIWRSPPQK